MARLPEGADKQDAAGNPGRRGKRLQKQIEEAERLAAMLSAAPGQEGDPLAPPAFLDKRAAPALAVWSEYAPRLKDMNLLQPQHRHTFAMFCVWVGEFVIANEDIQKNGFSKMVKTISKDKMWRENPAVGRRDTAMKYVMALAEKFGLTPIDQYKLLNNQAAFYGRGRGAGTGDELPGMTAGNKKPAQDAGRNPVGAMDGMDSEPPETTH